MAVEIARTVRRELTAEQHAHIRRHLALIPVYIWMVYGWASFLGRLPPGMLGWEAQTNRDFNHFYVQGVVANERNAHALYDMDEMAAIVPRVVPGAHNAPYPPVYGPQVSVFFSPLARLPYLAALYTWLAISVLVYAACGYAMWKACPRLHDKRGLVFLLLLAAPAFHFLLGFSQVSAIGLSCVTAAFFALRANRPFLAGLAIGSLAYKPPLGLAAACIFVGALEWRIVLGAATAAAAQIAAGCLYWGPAILPPYVAALRRLSSVAAGMEPYKFHMHSWRAFFDLLRLPGEVAIVAYVIVSLVTLTIALGGWRARGPLALRYSVFLIATMLVDPHLYVYDFILLTPAFLLLWDWILAERDRPIAQVFPWVPFEGLRRRSFGSAFQWLLYFCYYSPLFGIFAEAGRIQISVVALFLLASVVTAILIANDPRRAPGADVRLALSTS
jgi:hypothetical protein